jgi:hypothetical protein
MSRSGLVLGLGLAFALPLGAQNVNNRCIFEFRRSQFADTRLQAIKLPSGQSNIFLGGGVDAFCKAQNITLIADSAEFYGDQRVWYLIGNVRYSEPRAKVNSRRATYWTVEDRLLAEGDVVATMPNGSTMRGPTLEYFRVIPNVRPRTKVIAPGRPTIALIQKDTTPGRTEAKSDTVDLIANTVVMDGDSLVYAGGKVEITRPDLVATGDSAAMDSGREWARLMRTPAIEGRGERAFRLTGLVIDIYSKQRKLERVLSSGQAHAVSQDLDLTSDTIDMRVDANQISRAYAWGKSRARAVSPTQDMIADSLDVQMPGGRAREVHAVRRAFVQSAPDSLKIRASKEKDWIRGDTVVATFDTVAAGDTTRKPRLRTLVSRGHASSWYQIPSSEGPSGKPSINYVRGVNITVRFQEQQVATVSVDGQATGLFLEPAKDAESTLDAQGTISSPSAKAPVSRNPSSTAPADSAASAATRRPRPLSPPPAIKPNKAGASQ